MKDIDQRTRGKLRTISFLSGRCYYEQQHHRPFDWDFVRVGEKKAGINLRLGTYWISIYYL